MENQENQSNALSLPRVSFGKENLSVVQIPPSAPNFRPSGSIQPYLFPDSFGNQCGNHWESISLK